MTVAYEQLTDEELVKNFLSGDKMSFDILCNRYKRTIYHHVLRCVRNKEDAEDLGQEILIALYKQVGDFNPAKASWKTFLYQIMINKTLHHLRNQKRDSNRFINDLENQYLTDSKNISTELELKEVVNVLIKELQNLPEREREIISLRVERLSFEEIAKIVGSTYGAVKTSSCRTIKTLKTKLLELGYKVF